MKLYDGDTATFADSNVITKTEFYQKGVTLPERTVAMKEQEYMPRNDDYVVGGVAVMFFVIALVLFFQRATYPYRLKEFFSNKRLYIEEGSNENSGGALSTFLLISISTLCLTLIYFNDMAGIHEFNTGVGVPYWIIAAGYVACMSVVFVKAMLYSIVNWVFFSREECRRWKNGYFLITSLTALPIYPATLLYLFCPDSRNMVTVCGIFIVIVYEILLIYKLFVNFTTKIHGYLPLFLYFCSIEMMPAIVIWYICDWINNSFIVKNLIY